MQRYLQYEDLQKANLENFDNWASIFGETITAIELKVIKMFDRMYNTKYQKVA